MDYKTIGIIVVILAGIVLAIVLFFWLKPYFIKHDTTILFTGGLGSGKTLESVKRACLLVRKNRFYKYYFENFKRACRNGINRIKNKLRLRHAAKLEKQGKHDEVAAYIEKKPQLIMLPKAKMPLLYSNIPVRYRGTPLNLFAKKEWAVQLQVDHILLLKEINEYSVVLIDEFPQFISQFEWDEPLVQKNCNEFITFFRHYIGGHLVTNAQSEDEIECHFRRKLNIGIWCYDFKIWPAPFLPLFYTNRMCDFMLSENVTTMSTTYLEENTKIHFGFFPRKAYDSRCYSIRYNRIDTKVLQTKKWQQLKTNKILKLKPYVSPLDTKTTPEQIKAMYRQAAKLERNEDTNEVK